jgi:hypothetical protein
MIEHSPELQGGPQTQADGFGAIQAILSLVNDPGGSAMRLSALQQATAAAQAAQAQLEQERAAFAREQAAAQVELNRERAELERERKRLVERQLELNSARDALAEREGRFAADLAQIAEQRRRQAIRDGVRGIDLSNASDVAAMARGDFDRIGQLAEAESAGAMPEPRQEFEPTELTRSGSDDVEFPTGTTITRSAPLRASSARRR